MNTKEIADKLLHKLLNMRIFEDENGENKSCPKRCVRRIAYDFPVHLICQLQKGKPSIFYRRRQTGDGEPMYEYILEACRKEIPVVEQGEFGADMKVALVNDGPFTVVLDSRDLM